jgi:type IV fimbrial biogenesis protein FimT
MRGLKTVQSQRDLGDASRGAWSAEAEQRREPTLHGGRQRGFSLLELMVTLALAAVILTVGIPSFTTTTKNARMVSAANALLADLHYARDVAVTRNQRVVVCPSGNGTTCNTTDWALGRLIFVDLNNDGAWNSGEEILRVTAGTSPLSLNTFLFTDAVTFRPNGRAMGETITVNQGMFVLCDDRGPAHARGIFVERSGRPRVTAGGVPCPS